MTKTRIALVDDHQLFRKGIASLLESMEDVEVVIEADNGRAFLDVVTAVTPDIVLLDMQMPGMDGVETMKALRQTKPEVKVIYLTVNKEERLILSCMEDGANGFLQKDAHPDEMIEAIRRVRETGYYFNDRVSQIMLRGLSRWKAGEREGQVVLAERELEVLKLICMEHTTAEIASKLSLSPRTIEGYREKLIQKTKAKNTAGLVVFAAKTGWLEEWTR